jgi:hypothetical protein
MWCKLISKPSGYSTILLRIKITPGKRTRDVTIVCLRAFLVDIERFPGFDGSEGIISLKSGGVNKSR